MTKTKCNGNVFVEPAGAKCGAMEGELHMPGCPCERCSQCGGQYLYCECTEAFEEDVVATDKDPRPRLPFFRWPLICARCGTLDPPFFDVPTDVWQHYIEPAERDKIVCLPCWEEIATLIDGRGYEQAHGIAVPLNDIRPDAPPGSEARLRWNAMEAGWPP